MYKCYSPGNIGHGGRFKDVAEIGAKAGYEGYFFDIVGDSQIPVEETKEILAKYNWKAGGFALPLEFRTDEKTFEEGFAKLEDYVKYASAIGANRCVTWIFPFSDTYTWEENFEIHRSRLKKCCEVLKEYDMVFGMEFIGPPKLRRGVKHEFIHTLDQMLELCDAIGTGNTGLLLDVWHWDMARQTKDDFKKITNKQVALVHIMDAPEGIAIEDQEDLIRRLPGETGVLKIADFFDGLISIGYDGPVVCEPFEKKLADMTIEEASATVMAAMNKVWPK